MANLKSKKDLGRKLENYNVSYVEAKVVQPNQLDGDGKVIQLLFRDSTQTGLRMT